MTHTYELGELVYVIDHDKHTHGYAVGTRVMIIEQLRVDTYKCVELDTELKQYMNADQLSQHPPQRGTGINLIGSA